MVVMLRTNTLFIRTLSASLSLVLFATNCAFSHSPEIGFWKERQKATKNQTVQVAMGSMSLPAIWSGESRNPVSPPFPKQLLKTGIPALAGMTALANLNLYGTIRRVLTPPNGKKTGKVVLHIQDIHMNQEAQANIGKTVQTLLVDGKVGLLALEGAWQPINLAPFKEFPNQDTIRKAADYLLAENKISGPIHAALTSASLPTIVGIDDQAHYNANVEAYRESAKIVEKHKEALLETKRRHQENKLSHFNPELKAFDAKVEAYRTEKISMGEFAKAITQISAPVRRLRNDNLARFLEALHLEETLDLKKVESERTRLLERLLPKLSRNKSQELLHTATAYRLGSINHSEFYDYIQSLCRTNSLDLNSFPAMNTYIHYILLSESIDGEELFAEIKQLEESTYAALTKTKDEHLLIEQSNHLYLTEQLLNFSLTKEEWNDYEAKVHSPWSIDHRLNLSTFERFYREAEFRDAAMAESLLKALPKENLAVLVTGGFHSSGIEQKLTEAGCTVVTFFPKISKVDTKSGSAYLSVFTQEKTPLEKLFEGQKLFLAMGPISHAVKTELAIEAAATEFAAHTIHSFSARLWLSKYFGWVFVQLEPIKNSLVNLYVNFKDKKYRITLDGARKGVSDILRVSPNTSIQDGVRVALDTLLLRLRSVGTSIPGFGIVFSTFFLRPAGTEHSLMQTIFEIGIMFFLVPTLMSFKRRRGDKKRQRDDDSRGEDERHPKDRSNKPKGHHPDRRSELSPWELEAETIKTNVKRGEALLEDKKFEESAEILTKALDDAPKKAPHLVAWVTNSLGKLYLEWGRKSPEKLPNGIDVLSEYLKHKNNDSDYIRTTLATLHRLNSIRYGKQARYEEAIAELQKGIDVLSENGIPLPILKGSEIPLGELRTLVTFIKTAKDDLARVKVGKYFRRGGRKVNFAFLFARGHLRLDVLTDQGPVRDSPISFELPQGKLAETMRDEILKNMMKLFQAEVAVLNLKPRQIDLVGFSLGGPIVCSTGEFGDRITISNLPGFRAMDLTPEDRGQGGYPLAHVFLTMLEVEGYTGTRVQLLNNAEAAILGEVALRGNSGELTRPSGMSPHPGEVGHMTVAKKRTDGGYDYFFDPAYSSPYIPIDRESGELSAELTLGGPFIAQRIFEFLRKSLDSDDKQAELLLYLPFGEGKILMQDAVNVDWFELPDKQGVHPVYHTRRQDLVDRVYKNFYTLYNSEDDNGVAHQFARLLAEDLGRFLRASILDPHPTGFEAGVIVGKGVGAGFLKLKNKKQPTQLVLYGGVAENFLRPANSNDPDPFIEWVTVAAGLDKNSGRIVRSRNSYERDSVGFRPRKVNPFSFWQYLSLSIGSGLLWAGLSWIGAEGFVFDAGLVTSKIIFFYTAVNVIIGALARWMSGSINNHSVPDSRLLLKVERTLHQSVDSIVFDSHVVPTNGWWAETDWSNENRLVVRISPWLLVRSNSYFFLLLRALLLPFVLAHELGRIHLNNWLNRLGLPLPFRRLAQNIFVVFSPLLLPLVLITAYRLTSKQSILERISPLGFHANKNGRNSAGILLRQVIGTSESNPRRGNTPPLNLSRFFAEVYQDLMENDGMAFRMVMDYYHGQDAADIIAKNPTPYRIAYSKEVAKLHKKLITKLIRVAAYFEETVPRYHFVERPLLILGAISWGFFGLGFSLFFNGNFLSVFKWVTLILVVAKIYYVLSYAYLFATDMHEFIFFGKNKIPTEVDIDDFQSHNQARKKLYLLALRQGVISLIPHFLVISLAFAIPRHPSVAIISGFFFYKVIVICMGEVHFRQSMQAWETDEPLPLMADSNFNSPPDQTIPDLNAIADAYIAAFQTINEKGHAKPNEIAALLPLGTVGLEGNGTLTNLTGVQQTELIQMIKQRFNQAANQPMGFEQARNAAMEVEGLHFEELTKIVTNGHWLLGVKIQSEDDFDKALEIINAVPLAPSPKAFLFIPIKKNLRKLFFDRLGSEIRHKIKFVSSSGGFFEEEKFNLEEVLKLMDDRKNNINVGLQGEYEASADVLRNLNVRLVALDKILGGVLGVIVSVEVSERIQAFVRALIAA